MLKEKENFNIIKCVVQCLIFAEIFNIICIDAMWEVSSVKKRIIVSIVMLMLLSGCNLEEQPGSETTAINTSVDTAANTTASTSSATTTAASMTTTEVDAFIKPDELIPVAIQSPKVDGDRLSYTIINVYSEGNYYTVNISGVKIDSTAEADMETTYIHGELYGDFRLDLMSGGELLDSYKINVPRDDRFLIMESVKDNLSYGCQLISNKREFKTDEYPDLIQLDFHIINEVETPQYARFFAVFDGKLTELSVYEGGIETAPYGTHIDMIEAGVMDQYIVASVSEGNYTILKYEYTFDVEDRCLNRKRIYYW